MANTDKAYVVKSLCDLVEETQGFDLGYYVDEYYGEPFIFDKHDKPRQSIGGDSPIAIIMDFAKVLREDY